MAKTPREPVYLTRAQHAELCQELEQLETVGRASLAEELRSSPLSGMGRSLMDPIREKQAFLEGRISRLRATLAAARIIEEELPIGPVKEVMIGTTVRLHDLEDRATLTYSIVGPEGVDVSQGRISYLSPVGQALLGHHAGDTVVVRTPSGTVEYRIEEIARPHE